LGPSLLLLATLAGAADLLLDDGLDDTDSHGLPHVAHGETAQGRVVGEGLHNLRVYRRDRVRNVGLIGALSV
jgi:hypothetical protein